MTTATRSRARTRVLLVVAALLALAVAATAADAALRSRIESQLSATSSPVELTLGGQSVLWGYLTGTTHVDAHIDAQQMQDAISAKAGLDVGDVSITDDGILATLAGGTMASLVGGDVAIELAPEAVDGALTVSVSGIIIGGVERSGTALADRLGSVAIDPAEVSGCAALGSVEADAVSVHDGEMVVSLSVPTAAAKEFADCA